MPTPIFVNLPVKDLDAAKDFFTRIGYTINEQFTDDKASCVVISDTIYVMLLTEPFFRTFTHRDVADTGTANEVILGLGAASRDEVDALVDRALAAGGTTANDTMEDGPMYGRSFHDLDGHLWEVMYMDPAAIC